MGMKTFLTPLLFGAKASQQIQLDNPIVLSCDVCAVCSSFLHVSSGGGE